MFWVYFLQQLQENLAKAAQQNIEAWAQNEFEYRRRVEDLERETKGVQVSRGFFVCLPRTQTKKKWTIASINIVNLQLNEFEFMSCKVLMIINLQKVIVKSKHTL